MLSKARLMLLAFFLLIAQSIVDGKDLKVVNVLTWWGYLDSPWIAQGVETHCNAKLSYDSYSSNQELYSIWERQRSHYDVLIFS